MHSTHRLALATLFASVLAACGGGGGGSDPATPNNPDPPLAGGNTNTGGGDAAAAPAAGAGGPVAAPAPAPGAGGSAAPSSPPAAAFSAFEPVRIGENPLTFGGSAIARLAGGGNVALWAAPGSTARGSRVTAQLTDSTGNLVGAPIVVQDEVDAVTKMAVAPAPDGGFLVAWSGYDGVAMTPGAVLQNLQVRRYSADGVPQGTTRIAQEAFFDVSDVSIQPVAGGGFVVGWSASVARMAPYWGYLQRLGSAGELVGARAELVPGGGGAHQQQVAAVPLPDGTISAVWHQRSADFPDTVFSIHTRRFDASLQALGAPTQLADTAQAAAFRVAAAAVGSNIAIAWTATAANGAPELRTALVAPDASAAGTFHSVVTPFPVSYVRVLPFGAGEFGVTWQEVQDHSRGTNAVLFLQRYAATGAALGDPTELNTRRTMWVSPTTGATVQSGSAVAVAGGADGHVVATFQAADGTQPNQYAFGR